MTVKNISKKILSLMLAMIAFVMILPTNMKRVEAAGSYIIRVPFTATVVVNGKTLTDADMCDYGYMDGRIQRIAAEKYSAVMKYKDYKAAILNASEVVVYDENKNVLTATLRQNVILDYTSNSDKAFLTAIDSRIKGAATAYHNRVGGYGSTTFGSYFLNGSDAYVRACGSDAGRKWGQYYKAPNISSMIVTDVFRYTNDIFSAKVDVVASGSGAEVYSIYFLFKNVNGTFYVTNFTYQD